MQKRPVKILGTGVYLPENRIMAEEIDRRAKIRQGWTQKHSGVLTRYFVGKESSPFMGARAVESALLDAGIQLDDVDCLVCVSGTMAQPIPCTAALIKEELGAKSNFPAFDLNTTCLGFIAGLDVMSSLVGAGHYKNVVIVASEIASRGLNWSDPETCSILGDGAAAAVIKRSTRDESSCIIAARLETFAEGAHTAEIQGGGSSLHASHFSEQTREKYLFHMDGRAVFRMALEIMPEFLERLLKPVGLGWSDLKLVIPHQASPSALRLMQRKLKIPEEKFFNCAERIGNTIAASVPMSLHFARQEGKIVRGDKIILLGTSAGFSVGGIVLEF